MTSDNWDDWYWMAKQFHADPEGWAEAEQRSDDFASIMPTEKMWEIVRFFEFHGLSFEPESRSYRRELTYEELVDRHIRAELEDLINV